MASLITGSPDVLTIRHYRQEDDAAVKSIFATGMLGLIPELAKGTLKAWRVQAAIVAASGVAGAVAIAFKAPLWAAALSALLGALAVLVMGE